jgi:hypothetical protein
MMESFNSQVASSDRIGRGHDTDRSISRFTSVGHDAMDSCQTGPPAVRGPTDRSEGLSMLKHVGLSVPGPSIVKRSVGAELTQGGGAKPTADIGVYSI